MPSFKDQHWAARYEGMGDQAEQAYEQVCNEVLGLKFVRWGLDRPPLLVHKLPKRIRYSPDYLMTHRFVEVQGFGQDQIVKLKLDKYDALRWWNVLHPVHLFLFDSANVRWTFVTMDQLTLILEAEEVPIERFPEGHRYYAFPAEMLFSGERDGAEKT